VNSILGKAGHGQSASTTEKISDGIRSGFKKMTGKDVPIADVGLLSPAYPRGVADQAEAVESLRGGRLEFVANERVKFAFVALRVSAAITADLI
jgi:hypothetical protein